MSIRLLPKRLVGQTIRGIRTRLGMSQADFAHSLGVGDVREVGRWERGTAQPDYGTLAKIATMGVVDVLVFHETTDVDARPQLTPGEASELGEILGRMEALLADARRLVDRASNRTAVELLDAASPPRALLSEGSALVLDAEVRVEAQPRARSRTASASRRAGGSQARTRSGGGGRTGGASGTGSTSGTSSGESTGSAAKSGGSRASSSRSGGGSKSSRAAGGAAAGTTGGSRSTGGSSSGGSSSGGSSSNSGSGGSASTASRTGAAGAAS